MVRARVCAMQLWNPHSLPNQALPRPARFTASVLHSVETGALEICMCCGVFVCCAWVSKVVSYHIFWDSPQETLEVRFVQGRAAAKFLQASPFESCKDRACGKAPCLKELVAGVMLTSTWPCLRKGALRIPPHIFKLRMVREGARAM